MRAQSMLQRVLQIVIALWAACMGACAVLLPAGPVEAASPWSKPEVVFESSGYTSYPLLQADSEGDVHMVFMNFNQAGREVSATTQGRLMYARLHDGKWSTATDVLVPPDGGPVNLPAMTIDAQGYLHVVFQGGTSDQIYYSHAHVSEAGSARGWSKPVPISAGRASGSDISASGDGMLHIVYASQDGSVHYQRSADGGQTWSSDISVVGANDAAGPQTQADYPRVISDASSRVHVTWAEYQLPDGWPSVGEFYARSEDGGQTWSRPLRIAPQNYGFSTMISGQPGVIDRVWLSTGEIGERRHQQSTDGGQTWTRPELANDPATFTSGFTGFPGLAIDSAGILHVVTTLEAHSGADVGIYELTWNGQSWSQPTYISTGVGAHADASTPERSIEFSQIAISRGNREHVAYEENFGRIWYSTRLLSTPQLASVSVPRPVAPFTANTGAAATPLPALTPTAVPQVAPEPQVSSSPPSQPTAANPIQALIFTFVPSVLLVAAVVAWRMTR